jgi:hypothetical protein
LDGFGLQGKSDSQTSRLSQYFLAPIGTIMNEQKWASVDPTILMSCAHVIFRHALLDQLLFSMTSENVSPAQISPRIGSVIGTSKLRQVNYIF